MPESIVTGPGDLARLVQAYRDAEVHILDLLRRAVEREATGSAQHYANQNRELQRLLQSAEAALNTALEVTNAEVSGLLAANYQAAAIDAVPGVIPAGINAQAVNAITLEAAGAVASVRSNVLRDVADAYRRITQVVGTRSMITGENRTARLQGALNEYARRGITGFVDRSGRRWGIDTYADMSLRTAVNRAQNQGRREQYAAHGIDLLVTSSHMGCSDLCLPYQGRILSMTGPAGPRVIENEVNGGTVTVEVTATWAEAVAGGYKHPNCRHTETAYIGGTPLPTPVATGEEEYRVEQQQRYLERGIREWKKQEAVAASPERRRFTRGKVREWQARQRGHLEGHEWLTRRYDREQVRTGVASAARGVPSNVVVTESPFR